LHAVAFAIRELKTKLAQFTILCDHESVVSEANRERQKGKKVLPVLQEIRDELQTTSRGQGGMVAEEPRPQAVE